jgi:RNA polymerase sigma-70 factor, ECF subfamily
MLIVDELAAQAFRRHYRQIYGFVRRRTASDSEAEDIAAEVFADAAAALERFEPGATPVLAWLYTVARRRLADEARRRSRTPGLATIEPSVEYGPDVTKALRRSIGALPEGQRAVVVLKLIEGWSFREIAERLGVSEAACKMRLSRALEQLRDALDEEGVRP